MEGFSLEIWKRGEIGGKANKRIRGEGFLPAVVYHRGEASVATQVTYREFVKLATQARVSQVFNFRSSDSVLNGKSAIVRDIQKDALSGRPIHVDFQALKEDEAITVTIPLQFVGDAIGVKIDGGSLSVHTYEIEVSCLPKDIPSIIEVSVTELRVNSHIHAEDLALPAGVKLKTSKELPIVSVVVMKEEEVAAATPGAEGAAAGDAAAPAAAAAAAAPAKEKK